MALQRMKNRDFPVRGATRNKKYFTKVLSIGLAVAVAIGIISVPAQAGAKKRFTY